MISKLIQDLLSSDQRVHSKAFHKLLEIGEPAVLPLVDALRSVEYEPFLWAPGPLDKNDGFSIACTLAEIGQPAVPYILDALETAPYNNALRCYLAAALGPIGDLQAVEPLIEALKNPDVELRIRAAVALGELHDDRATEPLIEALADTDPDLRSMVARALGGPEHVKAVDPLISLLKDPDSAVRAFAAEALGFIGDVRAIGPLKEATDSDDDKGVRHYASWALKYILRP